MYTLMTLLSKLYCRVDRIATVLLIATVQTQIITINHTVKTIANQKWAKHSLNIIGKYIKKDHLVLKLYIYIILKKKSQ